MNTVFEPVAADEREALWTRFLERWPLERLNDLTLPQYNQAGEDDHFCRWVEKHTEALGSIWGGNSLKFGIYSLGKPGSKKPSAQKGVLEDGQYGWYAKYGASAEAAFATVRQLVVQTATAARAGRLDEVEQIDLWPIFRSKIAFLYQDRQSPCMLPIYLRPMLLQGWLGDGEPPKEARALYQGLMAQRGDQALLKYYDDVLLRIKAAQAKQVEDQKAEVLAHFDAVSNLVPRLEAAGQTDAFCWLALALNKAKLDWWVTGAQAIHAGRNDDPKVWQTVVALALEFTEKGIRGRLHAPGDGAADAEWELLDAGVVDRFAEEASADVRVPKLSGRKACWPDNYASQPNSTTSPGHTMSSEPLNQILFGPPGTGKTYATIDHTLAILDPAFLAQYAGQHTAAARAALKGRFDELKELGRVRFTTFHQSFSYEDFVEGIRAQSSPDGLHYSVEPGVFKRLCEDAVNVADVDKVIQQFLDEAIEKPQTLTTPKGKAFTVTYQEGNETVACLPAATKTNAPLPANIDAVKQLLKGLRPLKIYCESYVQGIVNHLRPKLPATVAYSQQRVPYVLIIDEINRGNVSRIFGELITLIEPSKRMGAPEALSATLPYSREPFQVPDNVYLIGTMNTADRSLAGLDVALRRRFDFKEMPPRPELLEGVKVQGVSIQKLLEALNARIEALLDREHVLGHAYFMPLKDEPTIAGLAAVFRNKVLPLLQEYFFDDWQRIQWVLNDHRKTVEAHRFVQTQSLDMKALFGEDVTVSQQRSGWRINDKAFDLAESYLGVIQAPAAT